MCDKNDTKGKIGFILFWGFFPFVSAWAVALREKQQPANYSYDYYCKEADGLRVIDVREDVSGPLFHSNKYSLHSCPWIFKGLRAAAFHLQRAVLSHYP